VTAAVQYPATRELLAISPTIAVVVAVVALLVTPIVASRRTATIGSVISLLGLLAAFALTFVAAHGSAFQSMIVVDAASLWWQRILLLFVAGVVWMGWSHQRPAARAADTPEYFVLLLSATCGMMLMASTTHLLTMLLAMELASMPSYVLAGFNKGHRRSAEASLKFALFGAVCTAIMIYGLSLVFGAHQSFDVAKIVAHHTMPPLAAVGWLFVLVGLLFKISGVPLHFWLPDTFDGAETSIAAFLSVASKGAGVALLARLAMLVASESPAVAHGLAALLAVAAIVTTTVGNFAAWRQTNVKRLLAYSSIAHAGYLLSVLALPTASGIAATAVYLAVYAVMNLGAFAVLADVESMTGSTDATAFEGLSSRSPLTAAAMVVCLFCMIGLPPVGFLAKWKIFAALGAAGGAWWIVVASVAINSIVSMAVYARILRAMYLRPASDARSLPATAGILGAACAVLLMIMLIFFAPVDRVATAVGASLVPSPGTPGEG